MKEREKFEEGMELCRKMLYGAINRLKAMDIENAYINSYDWRNRSIIVVTLKRRIL